MIRSELAELSAFATVAEERSFTRAASRLGISQSALSHSVRGLENRLGLQLLARTTRSVSPTAAGTALLQELAPALERIERAVAETRKQRQNPAGRIRLIIPRTAASGLPGALNFWYGDCVGPRAAFGSKEDAKTPGFF
jgi:DNA-binding transcriptional LysR family regulator